MIWDSFRIERTVCRCKKHKKVNETLNIKIDEAGFNFKFTW